MTKSIQEAYSKEVLFEMTQNPLQPKRMEHLIKVSLGQFMPDDPWAKETLELIEDNLKDPSFQEIVGPLKDIKRHCLEMTQHEPDCVWIHDADQLDKVIQLINSRQSPRSNNLQMTDTLYEARQSMIGLKEHFLDFDLMEDVHTVNRAIVLLDSEISLRNEHLRQLTDLSAVEELKNLKNWLNDNVSNSGYRYDMMQLIDDEISRHHPERLLQDIKQKITDQKVFQVVTQDAEGNIRDLLYRGGNLITAISIAEKAIRRKDQMVELQVYPNGYDLDGLNLCEVIDYPHFSAMSYEELVSQVEEGVGCWYLHLEHGDTVIYLEQPVIPGRAQDVFGILATQAILTIDQMKQALFATNQNYQHEEFELE